MQTNTQPGTTAEHTFFSCNSTQEYLFSVRPGVSATHALESASGFLDAARHAARHAVEHSKNASAGSAVYLIELASAVIESLLIGNLTRPQDGTIGNVFGRLLALRENGVLIISPAAAKQEKDAAEIFFNWIGQQVKGGAQ